MLHQHFLTLSRVHETWNMLDSIQFLLLLQILMFYCLNRINLILSDKIDVLVLNLRKYYSRSSNNLVVVLEGSKLIKLIALIYLRCLFVNLLVSLIFFKEVDLVFDSLLFILANQVSQMWAVTDIGVWNFWPHWFFFLSRINLSVVLVYVIIYNILSIEYSKLLHIFTP